MLKYSGRFYYKWQEHRYRRQKKKKKERERENLSDKPMQQFTQQGELERNSWASGTMELSTGIQQGTCSMSLLLSTCGIQSPAIVEILPHGTEHSQDSHTRLPSPKRAWIQVSVWKIAYRKVFWLVQPGSGDSYGQSVMASIGEGLNDLVYWEITSEFWSPS